MNTAIPYQDITIVYYALAAVLLPFAAFLVNICLPGKRNSVSGWVSTLAILISVVLSATVFAQVWNKPQLHVQQLWFTIGATKLYAGVLLNNLSVLMLLLVSLIALPVHIYSTAYMKYDESYKRYFTYLSLFCFSMLALVVVDNLILFYAFWELVGFSSYLLIGFWFTKTKAMQANKKAFIMNRIGDVGLLMAIMILFSVFHTFDIEKILAWVNLSQHASNGWLSPNANGWIVPGISYQLPAIWQYIAVGGIFLAVAAKSAQFPLHTWLPDAMEGPTSVSALIHAATMVAAGVFLLGRVYPLFNTAELNILAVIGCFTAFMAATIALTQNDLKRILAYSTISQLGYMTMAMGIGAYSSSLFHLVTHAFFKCLLFLVAGIVIHQMQHIKEENDLDIDPQNILHMGGLRKKLPLTFIAAVIGAVALIGLPLTSGYLSKDGILVQAFEWSDGKSLIYRLIPVGALVTSLLTAFYVARLIVKVFFGEFRLQKANPHIKIHCGDGGWQYTLPLGLLAVYCIFPWFSLNPFIYEHAWVLNGFNISDYLERINIYHTIIPVGITILNVFVIYFAYAIYVKRNSYTFPQTGLLFKLSYHEWYIDKIYNSIIVQPVLAISRSASWVDKNIIDGFINLLKNTVLILSNITAWIDKYIIDGLLHLLTSITLGIGNFARNFQSGKIQYYLFSMLAIILAVFIWFLI
ncbi:NADH-quinone oxidoreductase subunit L [Mucilaginibacter sp. X5P1]|uniref:NADH-quinone oxidoreductase subunit L n=1 Tax=Mucilaginibacter sp. X5P1 TaxID=2723088 RepID=UPI0017BDC82E|nr:NADH-quinone oxidoreductase subunit L [Mucilaginibacter sp. X5P1]MBB6141595.1 NADH-quinone oxidoreductase subunit L [Mucilaginibacter sp. X5P1]